MRAATEEAAHIDYYTSLKELELDKMLRTTKIDYLTQITQIPQPDT